MCDGGAWRVAGVRQGGGRGGRDRRRAERTDPGSPGRGRAGGRRRFERAGGGRPGRGAAGVDGAAPTGPGPGTVNGWREVGPGSYCTWVPAVLFALCAVGDNRRPDSLVDFLTLYDL